VAEVKDYYTPLKIFLKFFIKM